MANQMISRADWGDLYGKAVYLFTLRNQNGVEVRITNYGGIITSWLVPDRNGNKGNIVLGFDSLSGYLGNHPYFGAIIGRYANRIGKGRLRIDSTTYTLATNNGDHHLHGGHIGFDKVVWDAVPADNRSSLSLHYLSRDGEEGYPGNLAVTVTYTLTDDNELVIDYSAETDKATVVNLSSHSYFNLTADMSQTILDHTLQVNAAQFTPVDDGLIPTGELKGLDGTPFDFQTAHTIGEKIAALKDGYDFNFVLTRKGSGLEQVATLADPASGRRLEVYTTEPGMQLYTGNFLDGSFKTPEGKAIHKQAAVCLETQHYPDSPNQPHFPSTILRPGEKYHSVTIYKTTVGES